MTFLSDMKDAKRWIRFSSRWAKRHAHRKMRAQERQAFARRQEPPTKLGMGYYA